MMYQFNETRKRNEPRKEPCPVCKTKMVCLREDKRLKWRNFDHYEMEDAGLFWCDNCKMHLWMKI